MKYVLDTDHISFLQWKQEPEYWAIQANLSSHASSDISTCVVSFHEQVMGGQTYLARAKSKRDLVHGYSILMKILTATASGTVLPFDDAAATIHESLVAAKLKVKAMGLRIAAVVLSIGGTLVTHNTSDFTRIPGLLIEDWTR